MKKIYFALILLLPQVTNYGQQNVLPELLETPKQTIDYIIDDEERTTTVNDFYIAEFPEAVSDYIDYLNGLSESDRESAIPNQEFLLSLGLNQEQIGFILNDYYKGDQYHNYPIVGLDLNQVQNYLDWKTDKVGKAALRKTGFEFDQNQSYGSIMRSLTDYSDLPIQVNFLLPTKENLISAHQHTSEIKRKHIIPNRDNSNLDSANSVLNNLDIQPIQFYQLGNESGLCELILTPTIPKYGEKSKNANINYLGNKQYTVQNPSKISSTIFRVYHIKLKL